MKLNLSGAVARSGCLHYHFADTGLNRSLRSITVAHHSLSGVLVFQLAMLLHKSEFDSECKE